MSLHNFDSDGNKEGTKLMVQRKDEIPVIPKGREHEEKEKEEQEQEEAALGSIVKAVLQCQEWDDIQAPSAPNSKGAPFLSWNLRCCRRCEKA